MPYFREDMCDIRVAVDGTPWPPNGKPEWHSIEGGGLEAEDSKVRPGGMGAQISLGGPASRDDCTVSRPFDDVMAGHHSTLENKVREDAPVRISYQFLDRNKNAVGNPHVITGTLKAATVPDFDSDSGDASMYEIIVSCDEVAAQ